AIGVTSNGSVLLSDGKWFKNQFRFESSKLDETECCDLRGVARVNRHIWVVGKPGSVIFYSADSGTSWKAQGTRQATPLNSVHFVDEKNGWAVGELGTIIATKDGGDSWTTQRCGGQRAAILCIHAGSRSTPFDAVSALGGEHGYLVSSIHLPR